MTLSMSHFSRGASSSALPSFILIFRETSHPSEVNVDGFREWYDRECFEAAFVVS